MPVTDEVHLKAEMGLGWFYSHAQPEQKRKKKKKRVSFKIAGGIHQHNYAICGLGLAWNLSMVSTFTGKVIRYHTQVGQQVTISLRFRLRNKGVRWDEIYKMAELFICGSHVSEKNLTLSYEAPDMWSLWA